jgi:hypothetical protein
VGLAGLEGAAAQVEGLEARVIRADLEVRRGASVGCAAAAGAAAVGLAPLAGWAADWEATREAGKAAAVAAARGAARVAAAAREDSGKCVCLRGTLGTRRPPWRSTIDSCPPGRTLLCHPRPSNRCLSSRCLRAIGRSNVVACTFSAQSGCRCTRSFRACWRGPAHRCIQQQRRRPWLPACS